MSEYKPHECDFCPGTVKAIRAHNEAMRISGMIVLIEGGTIGKCDRCGHRYFPADIVKLAEQVALHPDQAAHVVKVPVVAA